MPISSRQVLDWFAAAGYLLRQISAEHAACTATLAPLHVDPFDRLLVAQSLAERLWLVTHDRTVSRCSDAVILV